MSGKPARLSIRVQPRASRTEVAGRHGDAIKIRVKAPPVEGAANDALVKFLAKRFGVRRDAVRIVAGVRGRSKQVEVIGIADDDAVALLLDDATD